MCGGGCGQRTVLYVPAVQAGGGGSDYKRDCVRRSGGFSCGCVINACIKSSVRARYVDTVADACHGTARLFAGIIFSRRRTTFAICLYSFFSVLILYGGIMNISSVLTYTTDINLQTVAAYIISGIPFDLIHAVSTVIFILIIGDALLKNVAD